MSSPPFLSDRKVTEMLFEGEEPVGTFAVLLVQFLDASHDAVAAAAQGLWSLDLAARSSKIAIVDRGLVAAFRLAGPRMPALELRALVAAAHQAAESIGGPCWACLGSASSGGTGIQSSYRDALEGVRVASALRGESRVMIADDLLPVSLLLAAPSYRERLAAVIAPLASGGANRNKLIETLRCYFEEDFSLRTVALRLHIHRHTVAYRLARAEKLLGRSLHDARDRLIITLALEARKIRDAVSGAPR